MSCGGPEWLPSVARFRDEMSKLQAFDELVQSMATELVSINYQAPEPSVAEGKAEQKAEVDGEAPAPQAVMQAAAAVSMWAQLKGRKKKPAIEVFNQQSWTQLRLLRSHARGLEHNRVSVSPKKPWCALCGQRIALDATAANGSGDRRRFAPGAARTTTMCSTCCVPLCTSKRQRCGERKSYVAAAWVAI